LVTLTQKRGPWWRNLVEDLEKEKQEEKRKNENKEFRKDQFVPVAAPVKRVSSERVGGRSLGEEGKNGPKETEKVGTKKQKCLVRKVP